MSNSTTNTITTVTGGTEYAAMSCAPYSHDMDEMLTLTKTGEGEFVLAGASPQKLLMEYFEQSPELWLRLMARKAEDEANG